MIDNNEMPSAADPTADYSKMVTAKMPSNMLANATDTGLSIEPQQEELSIYDQAVNDFDNQRQDALNTSFMSVAGTNPDKAAENLRIANQIGVGQDIVSRNEQESKKRNDIMRLQAYDLINKNAVLADLMTDPNFASVAHTDASELMQLSDNWKDVEVTGYPFVDYFIPAYTKQRLIGGFARGEIQAETKQLFRDIVKATTEEEAAKIEAQKFKIDKESEDLEPITSGWIANPAYGVAQFINTAGNVWSAGWKGALVGGGAAAVLSGGNPIAAGLGAVGGGIAASAFGYANDSFESNAGELYFDLRKKGYDRTTSMLTATVGGTIMASIDVVSFRFASAFTGKALSKLIQNEVIARIATKPITEAVTTVAGAVVPKTAAALIKPSITRAVGQAALESVKGTASEITGEVSQDAVQYLSETITYYLQSEENRKKLESPVGLQEFASQLVETAVQTMQMTLPLQLPGSMIHIYNTNKSIQQQKLRSKWMSNLKEKVDSIPLTKRSPITMQQFIAKSAEGTDASTVYIDGEELAGVLNQLQIPDDQIDSVLPGVRAQMKVAIETGGDVKISIGEYITNVGKTPVLYNALEQHVKIGSESGLASGTLSAKQAIARQESMQQNMKDAQAEMAVQEKVNAPFVREAKEIEKVVNDQLIAAGRPPTEAAFAAKLVQARAVTGAAAAGITPAQWVARHPVPTFQSQQQTAQAAQQAPAQGSLEQAAAPSSGVFDANNPPAPAKGERAIFAVMDYDGKIYYDRDATMHGDLVDTFPNITESIIDGGFIIDGKYQMGMSEGGYSAFEGTDEHQSEVRQFTEQANTTTPQVLRQELSTRRPSSVTATAMPSVTTANPISPIGMAIASANLNEVKSVEESDTFFKKVWKKLLIASGKQMRSKSDESVKEAAKLAVADIQDFVKNNPQFSDYYSQDWMKTRSLLDEYAGRAITDDEFQMYRVICGLTSPNTQLPSNISDTVKLWTHWMENGSFDGFLLGPKPITGASVVFESDEVVSGTTANIKIRTVKIIAQLVKELGSVKAAIDFLREPVTGAELNKVNKSLGYAGNVSNIGNIRALVKMATGQDKLIPRMFIFGQKVGAYTLNAVGDERFTTVDIWESRYIRSFFSGMFENEIGLPTDEKEHDTFVRFGYAFKDEMERVTGRTWTPSSLQALRWFYIIAATRSAGYSKASTNETISTYTSRVLQKQFDYNQSRKLNATRSTTTPPRRIAPQKYERDIGGDLDAKGITDPKQRREYTAQAWIQFARSNSESDPMGFQFDTNRSGVPRRSGPLKGLATVATHTPGSQLAKSLAKAGASIQPYVELAQTEVGAKAFSDRVRAINANSKFGTAVYVYSDTEYMGKRLFISESGKSGFALSPDGDIVSVFSEAGSREGRGAMALATQMGGTKLDCFDTVLPGYYAAHGFRAVARVKWSDEYTPTGWDFDAFAQFNGGRPDVVYMVYEANHFDSYSNKDGVVVADPSEAVAIQTQDIKAEQDRVAANKARYAEVIKPSQALFQAAESGARGEYDPIKNLIGIGKNADYSTVAHELAHWYVVDLFRTASDPAASEASRADADILLKWFGIAGDNVDQRLANWNAMTLDQQRRHHEAVAYNWELYLHTGKAPSVELQGVFDRFRRWLTRAYKSIRDDLNEIYRQQFGTDLPFLTDEVRGVFDRMLASEEQISRREAIDNFKGMYQTQEESGMSDAVWAAMQAQNAESHEMGVTQLLKETVKEMKWESGAKKGFLKKMQDAEDGFRKVIRSEESDKMGNEPVRKAERFFKTGKMVDPDGKEIEVLVGNKIDSVAVGGMYPTSTTGLAPAVDLTKLRGMTMEGGLAPDLAAEMFGFSSGDQLIRALAELKPFKDELKERTDARMLDEHGGMNTEAEKEEAVNKALANEVRARQVAVENRYLTKVKTPVAVIMQGAKELARTILGRMAIKDIKPRNYVAAEARVAKDKHTAAKAMQSPETAGKSAYTRSFNEQIAAGVEESAAASEALVKSVEAIKRAQAKIDAHKKQYGDVDPAIVAAKASHQQVIQGQLAKEGYKILDEVEKQVSLFKRFFKDDKKIAATRNMDLVNAARSILAFYGLGKHDKLPGAYLKQIQEYNPGLFETISAMVNEAQVGTPDYRLLTFEEFQSMQETVDALWQQAKETNLIKVEGKKIAVAQALGELNARIKEIGIPPIALGSTQALSPIDLEKANWFGALALFKIPESWAFTMDGIGKSKPFTKYLYTIMQEAINDYREALPKYVTKLKDLINEWRGEGFQIAKIYSPELNYTFGNGNGGIGKIEIVGALMHRGNNSNYRKLLLGRKWGEISENGTLDTSRWDAFEKRMIDEGILTKKDYDFVQAVWDLNEETKPIIQNTHRALEGYYFKEVDANAFTNQFGTYRGGYVAAKTEKTIARDSFRLANLEELAADFRQEIPSTGSGFTKERVTGYNEPLSLDIGLMPSHLRSVLRYAYLQPAIKDILKIIKNKEFAENLKSIDKNAIESVLIPWLTRTANQSKTEAGIIRKVTGSTVVDRFWTNTRKIVGQNIMFFNVRNSLQQPTGVIVVNTRVNGKYVKSAAANYLSNPKRASEECVSKSRYMDSRLKNQMHGLYDEITKMLKNPSKYDDIKSWFDTNAYFMQNACQSPVDVIAWWSKYNEVFAEAELGTDPNNIEKEAIQQADATVRLTQGSNLPENIAAYQVGSPFYQSLIQFSGWANMMANLNAANFVKIFRDMGWRGNKGLLLYQFFWGFYSVAVVCDVINKMFSGGFDDDDDDGYLDTLLDILIGSPIRLAASFIPGGGTVLQTAMSGFTSVQWDNRMSSAPSAQAIENAFQAPSTVMNAFDPDKDITGQNVNDVATLLSLVFKLPIKGIARPVSYLVDVNRGKVEPTSTVDLMRGLITGTATKESKKR